MKRATIQCSACGFTAHPLVDQHNVYSVAKRLINKGWRTTGVPYCPKCSRTWSERNRNTLPLDDVKAFDVLVCKLIDALLPWDGNY